MSRKARLAFSMGSDLVELRLDHIRMPVADQIKDFLFVFFPKAVVTVRPTSEGGRFEGGEKQRVALLRDLAEGKPAFVDVELATVESAPLLEKSLRSSTTIVSWHDFEGTPSIDELAARARAAMAHGDIAKIVSTARTSEDSERILSLYDTFDHERLIAFCMGAPGIGSRVDSARLGSPLAYCSLPSEPIAPGQLQLSEMRTLLEVARP
jgi:3-dehydroquinate dehydratase-1